ncbi:hypothetical protein EYZ11_012644 [Aspergillus tanneri]|uniref:Uncharacterized protein n=1 Tax=Aspergillus tanneri TaxID=1220188 RepID=A0A4S3IZP5_9EURO|nr:hypothetical protein EYZ11_012644 [Aspergillus tanneri]
MTLKPEQLPATIRGMLIRDIQMTVSIQGLLQSTIQCHPESLQLAISSMWPDTADRPRTYRPWRYISKSDMWMVSTATASDLSRPQLVHYHILEGHLLVDRKPVGKLPAEIRNADSVQELFGPQHLLVFPSALKDMTYVLSTLRSGHQIHFGLYEDQVATRARVRGTVLQFVERAQLWWYKRPGNWMLHVGARQASRRQTLLVDPHSNVFHRIAGIFEHFESADRLVVFQPAKRNLSVELKRMDLDLTVNGKGIFLCRQLRSEIVPSQDAGTWYGLQRWSMTVDMANT